MKSPPRIRPALETDLPAILAIYNDAVENTTAIWNETPADLANRKAWFAERTGKGFPVLVAERESVIGYGSFGDFRPFEGYRVTVEHSVYVAKEARGHGAGEALLAALMVANASASQGMEVEVYFAFWGIHLLRGERPRKDAPASNRGIIQTMMLWMVPRGPDRQHLGKLHMGGIGTRILLWLMRKRNILALDKLVETAVAQGVKLRVCSMSMGLMGLSQRDIVDLPNLTFAGVTSFAESARRSATSLVF